MVWGVSETKRVPLVIYGPEGRKVIGEAEVDGDEITANVTDMDAWKDLGFSDSLDHLSIGENVIPKAPLEGFATFIRRPFVVEAIEVTEENFDQIAFMTGTKRVKEDGTPFIEVDRNVIPNVHRVYVGFWVTQMEERLRAYSAKTFEEMFTRQDVE